MKISTINFILIISVPVKLALIPNYFPEKREKLLPPDSGRGMPELAANMLVVGVIVVEDD